MKILMIFGAMVILSTTACGSGTYNSRSLTAQGGYNMQGNIIGDDDQRAMVAQLSANTQGETLARGAAQAQVLNAQAFQTAVQGGFAFPYQGGAYRNDAALWGYTQAAPPVGYGQPAVGVQPGTAGQSVDPVAREMARDAMRATKALHSEE